jgi:hypothetical protein
MPVCQGVPMSRAVFRFYGLKPITPSSANPFRPHPILLSFTCCLLSGNKVLKHWCLYNQPLLNLRIALRSLYLPVPLISQYHWILGNYPAISWTHSRSWIVVASITAFRRRPKVFSRGEDYVWGRSIWQHQTHILTSLGALLIFNTTTKTGGQRWRQRSRAYFIRQWRCWPSLKPDSTQ